jgi:hypothetical protein
MWLVVVCCYSIGQIITSLPHALSLVLSHDEWHGPLCCELYPKKRFVCIIFVGVSPLILLSALIFNAKRGLLYTQQHIERYGIM